MRPWKHRVNQKSRSEVLQRNEQIKAASTLVTNAGLTLVAAGFGRWFLQGFDDYVILWLLASAGLMWSGVKLLTLLEAED
jgi:predicted neuraminidase